MALRDLLPDDAKIYFSHGDLTLTNIIVAPPDPDCPSPRRLAGIIDWEQAGWYPEHWEYCKMLYAVNKNHLWRSDGWVDQIVKPCENEYWAFQNYTLWRGSP